MVREVLDWDWTGAEAAFREAIRHNPGHAEAYHELGMLLMRLRRFDEALSATQRSLYVSPVSARYANGIMQVLLLVGRDDEALQMSKLAQALALGTQSGMVGLMLLAEYRWPYREALKTLDSLAAHGLDTRFARAYVRAKNGSNTEALRLLDTMKAEWRLGKNPKDIQAMDIATLLMALGQQQDALDWLERAIVPGTFVIYLGVWPAFEPLHGDARFRALTQQIGLPY